MQHHQSAGSSQLRALPNDSRIHMPFKYPGDKSPRQTIQEHERNLRKFKRIDVIQRVSSGHMESKLKSVTER